MDEPERRARQRALQSSAEWLISHTLHDLKDRATSDDEYKLLGLAGVLRRTLIDQHAIALQIQRRAQTPLEFRFRPAQVVSAGESVAFGLWLPEPGQFRVHEVSGTLRQFRAATIASARGQAITVTDLVKHFAHVEGGVHIGHPSGDIEQMMHTIFGFRTKGWRHGLDLLADVAYVAHQGISVLAPAGDTGMTE